MKKNFKAAKEVRNHVNSSAEVFVNVKSDSYAAIDKATALIEELEEEIKERQALVRSLEDDKFSSQQLINSVDSILGGI